MLFTKKQLQYDYDKSNDILYCSFADKSNSYGDEYPDNIIIMRDLCSNDITGVTVLNVFRMIREKDGRLSVLKKYINQDAIFLIFERIVSVYKN